MLAFQALVTPAAATASEHHHGCQDGKYDKDRKFYSNKYQYYIIRSSLSPGREGEAQFQRIREAMSAWNRVITPCKHRQSKFNTAMLGTGGSSAADFKDGRSSIDFGNGPDMIGCKAALGCARTHSSTNGPFKLRSAHETDIRFRKNFYRWNFGLGNVDSGGHRLDFKSVAVHEVGHAVGLDDLEPNEHPWLTMGGAPGINGRTLGRGDVDGLLDIYGAVE
jgi:hypothetical protein